jgi:hypothetical protein
LGEDAKLTTDRIRLEAEASLLFAEVCALTAKVIGLLCHTIIEQGISLAVKDAVQQIV